MKIESNTGTEMQLRKWDKVEEIDLLSVTLNILVVVTVGCCL